MGRRTWNLTAEAGCPLWLSVGDRWDAKMLFYLITSSKFTAGFRRKATKYPPRLVGQELTSMFSCVYPWKAKWNNRGSYPPISFKYSDWKSGNWGKYKLLKNVTSSSLNDFSSHLTFLFPWRHLPACLFPGVGGVCENVHSLGKCGGRRESSYRKHPVKLSIRPRYNGGGVNTCPFKKTFWIFGLFSLGPQDQFQKVPNHQLITLA